MNEPRRRKTPDQGGMGAFGGQPATHTRTCKCGTRVTVTGTIGPCNICDACAEVLLAVIWGARKGARPWAR